MGSNVNLRTIIVIFTPGITSIVNSMPLLTGPYLKIQIEPTRNGKNINSLKIFYSNPGMIPSRLNEEILDENVFQSLVFSMKGDGESLADRAITYMRTLPNEEISIIIKEYSKYIEDGVILDGLIAGIGAYMTFLLLNENGIFTNQMPFQFGAPFTIQSGNTVNKNMFRYLSLPLMSLSKVSQNILLQLILFIQSFINIWEPLFDSGPDIGIINESRLSIEIISGFSQYISSLLAQTKYQHDIMDRKLSLIEMRLQSHVDETLIKLKREVNNLIIDTKRSIKELTSNITSQLDFVDDSIKERICNLIQSELDAQIKHKIEVEIETSSKRHMYEQGDKFHEKIVNEKEDELKEGSLKLEDHIEILSDKLSIEPIEKIFNIENNNDFSRISEPPIPIQSEQSNFTSTIMESEGLISIQNNPENTIDGVYVDKKSHDIRRSHERKIINNNPVRVYPINTRRRRRKVPLISNTKLQ